MKFFKLSSPSLLIAFLCVSCASQPKQAAAPNAEVSSGSPFEVSDDCKSWRSVTSSEVPHQGFVRKEGSTLFVDLDKKMYATLEGKSAPFFFDASEISFTFVATPSGINGIQTETPEKLDSVSDLVRASERSANETVKSSRWLPIFIGERTKLVAVITGERCTSAQDASFINCETAPLSCSLYPSDPSESLGSEVSGKCLSELTLRSELKLAPVRRACDYFQSSSFEERRRLVLEKAEACGPVAQAASEKLPGLMRIEAGCEDLVSAASELQRSGNQRSGGQ